MAYDEELADQVRELFAAERGVTEKRMFGGLAFLFRGNMAVAVSGQGGLMVRCDPAQSEQLVAERGVSRMVMRGREMDGWLRVTVDAASPPDEVARWVGVGLEYARTLPGKRTES